VTSTQVPSTDSGPSLRIEYRRSNIAAFWALATTVLFVVLALAASAIGVTAPWWIASSVVAAILAPGIVWRRWFEKGIWLWNGGTYYLARFLSAYILRVSYWLLLAPLGASYSALDLNASASDRSTWIARAQGTGTDIDTKDSASRSLSHRKESGQGLRAFVRTSGNGWAAALVPLIFLLELLRVTTPDATPPGSTYTLY